MFFLSIEQEDAAANAALDYLSKRQGWARVQERLNSANARRLRSQDQPATLQARRREALRLFSFEAISYLDLVTDTETAEAFGNLLPWMIRAAYVYFCGEPPQMARPVSAEALDFDRRIEFRRQRWTARAYQRAQAPRSNEPGARVEAEKITSGRDCDKENEQLRNEGWIRVRRADWREDAAYARKCPPFLRPAKAARLGAVAILRSEAAEAVQRSKPQTDDALEQCLRPLFLKYAQNVFDRMAEAKLTRVPGHRPRGYTQWLMLKCLPAVVDDVCRPIFGQFPITVRYVAEIIGDVHWPEEAVRTRQVLWRTIADEVIPGSRTQSLDNHLSIALLEERTPHWEARAAQPQSGTAEDHAGQADRRHNTPRETDRTQANLERASGRKPRRVSNPDKGNLALLHGVDGNLKRAVTLDVARRFGGVSRRAIEKAVKKGSLHWEGEGPNRRILVQSLLTYFPSESSAN